MADLEEIASQVDSPGEVYWLTEACRKRFESLLSAPVFAQLDWLEDRRGEFNLWTSSLNAASIGRSSLDYRVRHNPGVREMICDLLGGLEEALSSLLAKAQDDNSTSLAAAENKANDEEGYTVSEDSDQSSTESVTSSEGEDSIFSEHMFNIKNVLGQLARIATAIRRSGAVHRHQKADLSLEGKDYSEFEAHLAFVIHLANATGTTKQMGSTSTIGESMLNPTKFTTVQQRLIHANLVRRNRIIFATRNMKFREPVSVPQPELGLDPFARKPTAQPESYRQEAPKSTASVPNISGPTKSVKTPSISKTATDMGPNFSLPEAIPGTATPSVVTRVTQIGATQDYPSCPSPQTGDWLQCPYCAELLPTSYSKAPSRWRGHVAQDILPYLCIYEACTTPNEMYLTSEELLRHMRNHHSVIQWVCNDCTSKSGTDQPFVFESQQAWAKHMQTVHRNSYPVSQLQSLAKVSQRKMLQPVACPLCGHSDEKPRLTLHEHIAQHLHDFSLRCLPWNTTGNEANSVSKKSAIPSDLSDMSSQTDSFGIEDYAHDSVVTYLERWKNFPPTSASQESLLSRLSVLNARFGIFEDEHSSVMERMIQTLSGQQSNPEILPEITGSAGTLISIHCRSPGNLWSYPAFENDRSFTPAEKHISKVIEMSKTHLWKASCIMRSGIEIFKLEAKTMLEDEIDALATVLASESSTEADSNDTEDVPEPVYIGVPKPCTGFYGRQPELESIRRILRLESGHRRIFISGLLGSGKTELVAQYLGHFDPEVRQKSSILWISALDSHTLEKTCARVVRELGITITIGIGPETASLSLFQHLSTQAGNWLLIIDDVTKWFFSFTGNFNSYLPWSKSGTIIFISRKKWPFAGPDCWDISVPGLDRDDSVKLLIAIKSFSDLSSEDDTWALRQPGSSELLDELSGNPMVIVAAASLMPSANITPRAFVQMLHDDRPGLLLGLVQKEWSDFFEEIQNQQDSKNHGIGLLEVLSCIEHHGIPRFSDFRTKRSYSWDLLEAYHLIIKIPFGKAHIYDMPRYVHRALRMWMLHRADLRTTRQRLLDALASRNEYTAPTNREIWPAFIPHTVRLLKDHDLDSDAKCHVTILVGEALLIHGRPQEAVKWLEKSSKVLGNLKDGQELYLLGHHLLAMAYQADGNVRALGLFQDEVMIRGTILPDSHPDLLASKHEFGGALIANGDISVATEVLENVVKTRRSVLSEKHPDLLASEHELARAYRYRGDSLPKAKELLESVVANRRHTLASDHPDLLASEHELARTYHTLYRYDDAINLLERVNRVQDESLAKAHPDRLASLHALALSYRAVGQVDRAIELLESVFETDKIALRAGHPSRIETEKLLEQYRLERPRQKAGTEGLRDRAWAASARELAALAVTTDRKNWSGDSSGDSS